MMSARRGWPGPGTPVTCPVLGLLPHMVLLDVHAGRTGDAGAHLREGLQVAVRTGGWGALLDCLDGCGYLCAATGRPAEAVTIWAAKAVLLRQTGFADWPAGCASGTSPCAPPAGRSDPAGPAPRRTAARR